MHSLLPSSLLTRSVHAGLISLLLLLGSFSVQAQTTNWTGGTSTDWDTPGNWDNGVPTATLNVVISSTGLVQPTLSTTATAKSVHVQTGASLSISSAGSLTINDFAILGGFPNAFYSQGTVDNNGTMILGNTAPVGQIGIRNSGTFTNTGTLQIDQITNEALINGSVFTNTGLIAIGSVVSGGFNALWNQASFSNSAGGRISIDGSTNTALYNTGSSFVNSATISIGASATIGGNGLTNSSSFTNATGGLIQIDRTAGPGVLNTATFVNAATINVGSLTTVNGNGIRNDGGGSFSNVAGGNLIINRSGQGLVNHATFVNSASVTIGNVAFSAQDCIYNTGAFVNNTAGEIRLDRVNSNGFWLYSGSMQNAGRIIVGSIAGSGTGVLVYAPFTNTGEIQVDRCASGVVTTSNFANTGQITLGASASLSTSGVISTGASATFVNSGAGTIRIDRTGSNGLVNELSSTFINSATITIGASGSSGFNNTSSFSNTAGGTIQIRGATLNGLRSTSGLVTNAGNIIIRECTLPALYNAASSTFVNSGSLSLTATSPRSSIRNESAFTNTVTGQIVMNGGLYGLFNFFGGIYTNAGLLTVGSLTSSGQSGIENYARFVNQPTGVINLDRVANGIWNLDPNSSTFTNGGQITIGAIGGLSLGINNQGTFSNSACAMLTTFAPITNPGSWTNAGFFTVSTTQPHSNTGTLLNNGVISYPQGNPIPNVTNNDLIAAPVTVCGTASSTALQIGGSNSFSAGSTWYTDAALTTVGGTYDGNTNTFTPGSLSVGVHTLYFTATDNTNSCSQTVGVSVINALPSVSLSVSGTLTCAQTSVTLTAGGGISYTFTSSTGTIGTPGAGSSVVVNQPGTYTVTGSNASGCTATTTAMVAFTSPANLLTWTGNTSTDWNTATNWCPPSVPTATDNVLIPAAPANQPIISTTAVAKSVNVTTGASLSISATGSLSINGSTSHALSNSGLVTNEGSFLIGSLTTVAGVGISIAASGTITNSGGGLIQIDRTGSHAIQTAGLLNNASIMRMGSLTTVGGSGISNTGRVNNLAGGQITINRSSTGAGSSGLFNGATGTFVNSATITVGDIVCDSQDAVFNAGSFTNTATGEMQFDRVTGNGIWHSGAFAFRNDGKIRIGSLANTGGSGILNAGASFSNTAGAIIELDRVGRGITNTKPFVNAGQIRMGQNAAMRGGGILNGNGSNASGATFTNLAGGLILIDQSFTEGGIINEGSTTFTNGGTVSIGASGTIVDNAILNTGTFTNLICGVVRVFAPIYNENGTITNNGFFTVNTLRKPTKTVLRINSPSGIARTYVFGPAGYGPPLNRVNLTADAVMVNDGTASLTQTGCAAPANAAQLVGKIALVDQGICASNEKVYFAQQAGAIAVIMLGNAAGPPPGMAGGIYASLITIPAMSVSQADGAAIKAALTLGPVNISITQEEVTSTTLVTNNGVLSYLQGNPMPNVTNNALLLDSFSLCAATSTTALQVGGATSFSAGSTWYTDAALSTAGGTYNAATNTFTPGSLSVGAHTLYFTATDNTNSCAQTVAVSLTVNALPTPTLVASGSINCTQTSVTLTASGGVSYTFADASGPLGTPGSVSTLTVSAGGTYSVTVGNANGCVSTATTTVLSSTALPVASLSAVSLSFCAGSALTLAASGGVSYTFGAGATQTGGSSSNTATVTQSGVYSVTVANADGCTNTTTISVTAIPAPNLVNGPVAGSVVCVGASVMVPVSATGSANLTYAWYRNGSLTGQTSATLSLPSVLVGDAGSYSVVVTGACGSVTSTAFSLTVNPNPVVTITPGPSLTISSIQTATFTASGGTTYNWSTLANTPAIQVSVGGTYSVTGTTNGCSGTASVVLSVTSAAPIITTQPATASSVCEGASVMVSVVVSNSVTSYQWLKGGSPVSGQTSATLSLGNVQVGDAGVYSLSVTGPGGSTTSNDFTLTVNPLPTVTLLVPNNVGVLGPGAGVATITVPANGLPTTFQATGGVLYERLIILDRTNGYEVRQIDSNTTGIFLINRMGLFTLTVTGAGGCKRTVQAILD